MAGRERARARRTKKNEADAGDGKSKEGRQSISGAQAGVDSAELMKTLEQARESIFRSLPSIVDAMIAKASKGNYLHAKCLFELARISEVKLPKPIDSQGWAARMLNELRAIRLEASQREPDVVNPSSIERDEVVPGLGAGA